MREHRDKTIELPHSSLLHPEGGLKCPLTARIERPSSFRMILPSSLVTFSGMGLIDLPLRASNEGLLRPRVARALEINRLHPPSASKKGTQATRYTPHAPPI